MNTTASGLISPHRYAMQSGELTLGHGDRPYPSLIRDLPSEEKPREKLLRYGPAALFQS